MSVYLSPFTFDFTTSQILVDGGTVNVACVALWTAIKQAQMSVEGIIYPVIASGSGLKTLSPGVQTGLTVSLLGNWQLKFPAGSYVATVGGGNLIGGLGDVPVAYSAGVQVSRILSAASTVVTSSGDSAAIAAATVAALNATAIPVNIVKVNSLTVDGTGTNGDPWGPA